MFKNYVMFGDKSIVSYAEAFGGPIWKRIDDRSPMGSHVFV